MLHNLHGKRRGGAGRAEVAFLPVLGNIFFHRCHLLMKIEARRTAAGRGKERASVGQEADDARKGSPSVPSQRGQ